MPLAARILRATLLCAVAGVVSVVASAEPPRVWCWTAPQGPAATHPSLIKLVQVWITPASDPVAVANTVCQEIAARGLAAGEVTISLLNWGNGTLMGNPSDAMVGTGLPDHLARGTPWSLHGVPAMHAWTDAFIARYQQHQAQDRIPAPSRFHLDCELRLPARCFLPSVEDCWGTPPLEVFDAMRNDSRWATELLPMNPAGVPTPRTMAELHESAGAPSYNAMLPRDDPTNRTWSSWWDGLMREAVEGAIDQAFYQPVRAAWPAVKCSEFAQSMKLDGGTEPDGAARQYVDFEWWNEGWMHSQWCGRADLQAPALYLFGETFVDPGQPFMDEQMRLHRRNLDACLHSFGGVPAATVTPWVMLPRHALPFGEQPPTSRAYTDPEFLRVLALLHSRGIEELMVWSLLDAAGWSATADAIDAVWTPTIVAVDAVAGAIPPDARERLTRADRVPCAVLAGSQGIDLTLDVHAAIPDECEERGVLWVATELTTPVAASWSVRMRAADGTWTPLGAIESPAGLPSHSWIGPIVANGLVAGNGTATLRVSSANAPAAEIDLIQVSHAPTWTGSGATSRPCGCATCTCTADITRDGIVNGLDLSIVLTSWGTDGQQGEFNADLDGDGIVNGVELGLVLTAWGPCGDGAQ